MKLLQSLREGNFFLKDNFFDENTFLKIQEEYNSLEFLPYYQPKNIFFGNRFQAYPTYETTDLTGFIFDEFVKNLNNIIDEEIESIYIKARYTLSEEVKQCKAVQNRYGFIHKDGGDVDFACMFYFDTTPRGGTAFYDNEYDKYPMIEVGAKTNRLLLYNANRNHAVANDLKFDKRKTIIAFFKTRR